MARSATAVIGAGYGDEGKGAFVDRFSGQDVVVVRHNGGCQAGHTVVTPDGRRHVFHHVGAGAFRGASTYLARRFVSNPMALFEELEELAALGVDPMIAADPRGLVTTPYDMAINRTIETARGAARHGSCGLGVGETVERSEAGLAITVADLREGSRLAPRLRRIRDEWVPARLRGLGLDGLLDPLAEALAGEAPVDGFLDAAAAFLARVEVRGAAGLLRAAPAVVFEGAQGLLLDQDRGTFPYVTRSHTGLRNVVETAEEAGIGRVAAVYATRCYVTRHGAGPLAGELPGPAFAGVVDDTNQPNDWQGTIRHALLDADRLDAAIRADLADVAGGRVAVEPTLAVSCLDQADPSVPLVLWGRPVSVGRDDLPALLLGRLGFRSGYAARSAARDGFGTVENGPRAAAA